MARKPSPWYWPERNGWYTILNGQRHSLGDHPADTPPPQKRKGKWVIPAAIDHAFHKLLVTPPTAPPPPRNGLTVAEAFDKFLDWCQKHREGRTYKGYLDYIQNFTSHLGDKATMLASALRPFNVVEWVDSQSGWNDTTRRNAIIHVTRPFNWAAKLGYILDNPIRHIEKPQAKRRDNPVMADDFTKIIGHVKDEPFRDLLSFAWESGCRPQEVRHIEIRHVELDNRRIVIPPAEAKGRKRWRLIRLNDAALAIIRRRIEGRKDGKLFLNTDGNPWKVFAICNRFNRLQQKLGKKWAAYDLRHGFCQKMLESGADHLTVAELMGHANGQMVAAVYSHMNRADSYLQDALKKASSA